MTKLSWALNKYLHDVVTFLLEILAELGYSILALPLIHQAVSNKVTELLESVFLICKAPKRKKKIPAQPTEHEFYKIS